MYVNDLINIYFVTAAARKCDIKHHLHAERELILLAVNHHNYGRHFSYQNRRKRYIQLFQI